MEAGRPEVGRPEVGMVGGGLEVVGPCGGWPASSRRWSAPRRRPVGRRCGRAGRGWSGQPEVVGPEAEAGRPEVWSTADRRWSGLVDGGKASNHYLKTVDEAAAEDGAEDGVEEPTPDAMD